MGVGQNEQKDFHKLAKILRPKPKSRYLPGQVTFHKN